MTKELNKNNLFPIDTKNLLHFLPHRPPMVWIDKVLKTSDQEGECLIELDKSKNYFDSCGYFRESSYLEIMAQSFGFIEACNLFIKNSSLTPNAPQKAFLASVTDLKIENQNILDNKLVVHILIKRKLESLTMVTGTVYSPCQKTTYATGNITIYIE